MYIYIYMQKSIYLLYKIDKQYAGLDNHNSEIGVESMENIAAYHRRSLVISFWTHAKFLWNFLEYWASFFH